MRNNYVFKTACTALLFLCIACSSDNNVVPNSEENNIPDSSLAALTATNTIEVDNVIACAAGSPTDPNTIIAFVYPREEATDIRFFETESIEVDKNDYTNYEQIEVAEEDFFNGYLKMFKRTSLQEKWVIITFFEDNILHLSNPIRLKHLSKPTEYTDVVNVSPGNSGEALFEWEDGIIEENAIYFQVISDEQDNLLSGTYTFEQHFLYYVLDNVVLNITEEIPPELESGTSYNFTLMGVSEDNWVNLFIQKSFIN
ncbi:hypothetical protein GTQ40_03345 [Flavobacteriaceae bacterium R38]|nr:hypothetical protein [Flavobacteriaceae bacterium R38]